MKNFKLLTLFIVMLSCSAINTNAQIVSTITPTKTSLSSTDTAYSSLPITSVVKSIEIGATKTSGTVGGKVYFLAQTLDGATWEKLDSMSVANSAGLQYKLITTPANLIYKAYKFQYLSTGGVWVPSAYYLRRN
jgi:hypothetical protein